jgi:hypothetical protein
MIKLLLSQSLLVLPLLGCLPSRGELDGGLVYTLAIEAGG